MANASTGIVVAVCRSASHSMSKPVVDSIRLLAGLGVEGDAHQGVTVKHRSRVARDPSQPNLRQLHLIAAETHEALAREGFSVAPGQLGENVTTRGIDWLACPPGTRIRLGDEAVALLMGLRNPCGQLNGIAPGLMAALLERRVDGSLVRKAGVMAVVRVGGALRAGDAIRLEPPAPPHAALEPV
jgi:MOSC domain-containing protein YiiM